MKGLWLAFLICLLSSFGCRHPASDIADEIIPSPIDSLTCEDTIDIFDPGKMGNGYFKAVKTCRDWMASGQCKVWGNFISISAETYFYEVYQADTTYYDAEWLNFYAPPKVGKYKLINKYPQVGTGEASIGFLYLAGDVIVAFYSLDTTATDNFIEITEIDEAAKHVKGKFTCSLVIVPGADTDQYPARLRFFNGEFDVKQPE